MDIQSYLKEVTSHIRSKEAKKFVKSELENHLHTVYHSYKEKGYSHEEAESLSIKQMGEPKQLGLNMNKLHKPKIDWFMLVGFFILIGLSFLPMVYIQETVEWNLLFNKTVYTLLGVAVLAVLMFFDYRKFEKFGYLFFILGIGLLLLINLSSLRVNGRPYLYVPGFGGIESSYTLPLLLLAWASILSNMKNSTWITIAIEDSNRNRSSFRIQRIWQIVLLFLVSVFMLLLSSNLFLVLLYTVLVVVMVLFSTLRNGDKYTFSAGVLIVGVASFVFSMIQKPYMLQRFKAFITPEEYANTSGYMLLKVKELIGEAGWFGKELPMDGFHLPGAHTDLIFVTLTYGYGWLLAGILVIILFALSIRMISVVKTFQNPYGKLLTIGAITLYTFSISWSILMTLGVLPLVGVSLPFFSYGLMPTILHSFLIGIVLSVYRRKDISSYSFKW
jgi:cell division protein FtsW (lipid II flippase)